MPSSPLPLDSSSSLYLSVQEAAEIEILTERIRFDALQLTRLYYKKAELVRLIDHHVVVTIERRPVQLLPDFHEDVPPPRQARWITDLLMRIYT